MHKYTDMRTFFPRHDELNDANETECTLKIPGPISLESIVRRTTDHRIKSPSETRKCLETIYDPEEIQDDPGTSRETGHLPKGHERGQGW